jgi:hypothetical protein
MRTLFNLVKVALHLAVAGVLGYYNFTYNQQGPFNGHLALITNVCFLLLGASMVLLWRRAERNPSEHFLEVLSSSATGTPADAAENPAKTGKAGMNGKPIIGK